MHLKMFFIGKNSGYKTMGIQLVLTFALSTFCKEKLFVYGKTIIWSRVSSYVFCNQRDSCGVPNLLAKHYKEFKNVKTDYKVHMLTDLFVPYPFKNNGN